MEFSDILKMNNKITNYMSNSKHEVDDKEDYFAITGPSSGGTIGEFAEFMRQLGNPAYSSTLNNYIWVPGNRNELQRFPLECTDDVDKSAINMILKEKGIWILNYLLHPDEINKPNCFNYICDDPNFDIANFSSSRSRRDIRRGLRNFDIRLCSCDELRLKGFQAYKDTTLRHGYSLPDEYKFSKITDTLNSQFYDIWGAWEDKNLMAWMTILKIDNWAMIDVARSCTQALKKSPNDALIYSATKYLMNDEKRKYITYGLSSIQLDVNELSMHRYKLKVGYRAVPMFRKFEVHSIIRPFVYPKLSSWFLEKVANRLSKYARLRKLAGLSRILSGREKDSLNRISYNEDGCK